jgi:hypothetical protein
MLMFLLAIALAALTGFLVETVTSGAIDSAVSAFRELLGGWRADGWPIGVQEEDRDRPWGSGIVDTVKPMLQALIDPAGIEPITTAVVTGQVKPRTRPR